MWTVRDAMQQRTINFLWALLALWLALFCAWQSLSQINFLYPVLHSMLNISETVLVYGPQNRYKQRFSETTPAEQSRLFAEIVRAVNHDGNGLAA
ncbi:MAG: Uncharacterized protein FD130_938, partial [Halothiobacillaceae bacterium]